MRWEIRLALAAVGVCALSGAAQAASITWGLGSNISADTDVATAGVLDRAYNFGDASVAGTTVNGVHFDPFTASGTPTATVGSTTLSATGSGGGVLFGNNGFGFASPPFANLSASYQDLLGSAVYHPGIDSASTPDMSVTLGGLTAGNTYLLQLFVNDSRQQVAARFEVVSDGNGHTVTLPYNTAGINGGVGRYVTGTFIADSASQVIDLHAFADPHNITPAAQLNGLQLRVTASAVPLPSAACAGLALMSGLGATKLRRRNQEPAA